MINDESESLNCLILRWFNEQNDVVKKCVVGYIKQKTYDKTFSTVS